MAYRRFVPFIAPVSALLVAMTLLIVPPSVRATDPPPGDPPPSPQPAALTIIREPAFNPASPLLGRVQILNANGAVVQSWTSPQPNDMFGLSAVLVPDANSDGIDEIAIAAPNAFDDVVGARIGTVSIKSGADGSTIASITGIPHQRFGLALYAAAGAEPGASPTVTVLVEHLDPNTGQPYQPSMFTFQTFDAFSGWLIAESVPAPAGFTAQTAIDSLATHIRATGPADLNADGTVTASDLAILAGNYGAQLDPVTGALLHQDPTLAAAPTGDTNGDGVVDVNDMVTVVNGIGSQNPDGSPNFVPIEETLTEAEATAIEGAFDQAMPQSLDCVYCALCHKGWCQVLPDRYGEVDGDEGPEFADGGDGVTPPGGGTGPGGGNPGPNSPNGDDNGDGIKNKDDCLSPLFAGNAMGCDSNGNDIPDPLDCGSCKFIGDITQCTCADVDITFSPGCPDRSPNYVWIIPEHQLPREVVIRACAGPPGGSYRWLPLQSDVAEYVTGQDLTGSSVRVLLKTGGNFWATCEYTVTVDEQPCSDWAQFSGAVVHSVKLESVEFSGGHTVLRDDGTAYPSPAWKDANLDGDTDDEGDHRFPIAFTRNTPWRVQAAIVRLEPPDVEVGTVTLTMTSQGKPTIETESTKIGGGLRFASQNSTDMLPNTADYDSALQIKWDLDFGCDGTSNKKSFTTRHPYYVTLGEPQVQLRHTVLHLACKNSVGASTQSAAIGTVWSQFQNNRDTGLQRIDGVWMTYWNPQDRRIQWLNSMLISPLGNGTCTSWAALFRAALRVHGISGATVVRISPPGNTEDEPSLLVRNWAFTDNPMAPQLGCNGYEYSEGIDVVNALGVPGQGNPDPPESFFTHYVVQYLGQIYDPSYGIGPVPSRDVYEFLAFAGYDRKCDVDIQGLPPQVYFAKPEDPGAIDCTYNVSERQE